jgi:hypothetical protein
MACHAVPKNVRLERCSLQETFRLAQAQHIAHLDRIQRELTQASPLLVDLFCIECRLLAQSGLRRRHPRCPLAGAERDLGQGRLNVAL